MTSAGGASSRESKKADWPRAAAGPSSTIRASNTVIGDVLAMQELRVAVARQAIRLVVAGEAALARHVALAPHHARVARAAVQVVSPATVDWRAKT